MFPFEAMGAALIWGINAAQGTYVVMGDADDSYDFREAVAMVRELESGYDLVVGTRLKGRIMPGAMPWKNRYLGTPVLTAVVNSLYQSNFSDVNCGMRAFSKRAFQRLQMESPGMEFASEMLVKAAILGLKITEVPITLHRDGRDRPPHLRPWSDGWRHLKYILLFAPKIIYWVPGSFLLSFGLILAAMLNLTPGGEAVYIGNFRFNDHWIVVAALACLLGYELLLTGLLAHLYTLTHRIQRRSPPAWIDSSKPSASRKSSSSPSSWPASASASSYPSYTVGLPSNSVPSTPSVPPSPAWSSSSSAPKPSSVAYSTPSSAIATASPPNNPPPSSCLPLLGGAGGGLCLLPFAFP